MLLLPSHSPHPHESDQGKGDNQTDHQSFDLPCIDTSGKLVAVSNVRDHLFDDFDACGDDRHLAGYRRDFPAGFFSAASRFLDFDDNGVGGKGAWVVGLEFVDLGLDGGKRPRSP